MALGKGGMAVRIAALGLLLVVVVWHLQAGAAPIGYRLLEVLPMLVLPLMLLGLGRAVPRRGKILGVWLAALVIPYLWAFAAIYGLFALYGSGPRPYQSWDVGLTYLWLFYLALFYAYAFLHATAVTLQPGEDR